jgi:hypothetical protein
MKFAFSALTVTGVLVTAAPAQAQGTTPVLVSHSETGDLQAETPPPPAPNTAPNFSFPARPGTSPAVVADSMGGYVIAFQSFQNDIVIELVNATGGHTSINVSSSGGLPAKIGTSPSIARDATGYKVAYQAFTGELVAYSQSAGFINFHLAMGNGTSPSITALTTGGFEIAFQANTGQLWTVSPVNVGAPTTGSVRPRTSPSIAALPSGAYEIAFQDPSGNLDLLSSSASAAINTTLGMMAGTSPAITGLSAGSFEVAYQASTGLLSTAVVNANGSIAPTNLNLGMMPGTSPAITAVPTGAEIAFQANTGALWLVSPAGSGAPANQSALSGTSPALTAI